MSPLFCHHRDEKHYGDHLISFDISFFEEEEEYKQKLLLHMSLSSPADYPDCKEHCDCHRWTTQLPYKCKY